MQHAPGARMLAEIVDAPRQVRGRARASAVERMQHRRDRNPIRPCPNNAVPESIDGDRGGPDAFNPHLFADLGNRSRNEASQLFGIDLPAAVFRRMRLVLYLRPESGNLSPIETKQKRASGRAADIKGKDAIHLSVVARNHELTGK